MKKSDLYNEKKIIHLSFNIQYEFKKVITTMSIVSLDLIFDYFFYNSDVKTSSD